MTGYQSQEKATVPIGPVEHRGDGESTVWHGIYSVDGSVWHLWRLGTVVNKDSRVKRAKRQIQDSRCSGLLNLCLEMIRLLAFPGKLRWVQIAPQPSRLTSVAFASTSSKGVSGYLGL